MEGDSSIQSSGRHGTLSRYPRMSSGRLRRVSRGWRSLLLGKPRHSKLTRPTSRRNQVLDDRAVRAACRNLGTWKKGQEKGVSKRQDHKSVSHLLRNAHCIPKADVSVIPLRQAHGFTRCRSHQGSHRSLGREGGEEEVGGVGPWPLAPLRSRMLACFLCSMFSFW